MAARRQGDEALETQFLDIDLTIGAGDDPAVFDQEGLGGVGADRDLAGDCDGGAVEDSVGDLDPPRMLGIEAVAAAQVEKARAWRRAPLRSCRLRPRT